MLYTDASIYFIIAILSVAYPILLQVIGRLDERYNSSIITKLFQQEHAWQGFSWLLKASLISTVVFLFVIMLVPASCGCYSCLLNILSVTLFGFTVALIWYFFLFTRMILTYYTPADLIAYLQKERISKETEEYIYFKALADILYLSIAKEEETNSETLSRYFYQEFRNWRESSKEDAVRYPVVYYEMVYKTVRDSAAKNSPKLGLVTHRASSGLWLTGEWSDKIIHVDTYAWLWRNLVALVDNEMDQQVLSYWGNMVQYFSVSLPVIREKRSPADIHLVLNKKDVDQRESNRDMFFEFNTAVGALLLHRKRYNCLQLLLTYTTSIPSTYDLLPNGFSSIINLFVRFCDPQDLRLFTDRPKYWFSGLAGGISSEQTVKNALCKYMAVLMIRQYSLTSHYYGYDPLRPPMVPNKLTEKMAYLDLLDYFKNLVEEVMGDEQLIKDLQFDFLNKQWFATNKKRTPVEIIDDFKLRITAAIEAQKANQQLHRQYVQQFLDTSIRIISERISSYNQINNPIPITEYFDEYLIKGARQVSEKSPFVEEQAASHLNFDSFLASMTAQNITDEITRWFRFKTTQKYVLKKESLVAGMSNLQLNSQEHVIINFGIDIPFLAEQLGLKDIDVEQWSGIPMIMVNQFNWQIISSGFVILRRSDLPQLQTQDLSEDEIQKYELEALGNHIYGSVIDLHSNAALSQELEGHHGDLEKSVLMSLGFTLSMKWRKKIKMVMISLYDEFLQQGSPNKAEEVKPFRK